MGADGTPVTEKLPAPPFKTFLDKEGNVRRITMSNGAAIRDPNRYAGQRKTAIMINSGCVPYYQCPMHRPETIRWVPEDLRKEPCTADVLGEEHGPCVHVSEMEKRRRLANQERTRADEERYKTWDQRRYELAETEHRATIDKLTGSRGKTKG
jgi:hypothetical protein